MRKVLALLIGVLPLNVIRISMYKLLMGYKIDYQSYVGWGNYILCESVSLSSAKIGRFNRILVNSLILHNGSEIRTNNNIKLLNRITLKDNSLIISSNDIIGLFNEKNPEKEYSIFELGYKSLITSKHHIDATDIVSIGDNVVLGGVGSSIWTHGFDICRNRVQAPVYIGNDIYIGAGVTICQGVRIADKVVIGAATCVSRSVRESGFYVSNQLIKKTMIKYYNSNTIGQPEIYRKS